MVGHSMVLLDTHGIYSEGNMVNIPHTIMIDISRTPGKIENIYIGADCSKTYILVQIVHLKKFIFTLISLRNFMMYFLGRMKRFQGSTLVLLSMKIKII
jgi:hypothetical protein